MPMCGISALKVEVAFAAPFRIDELARGSEVARGHGGLNQADIRGSLSQRTQTAVTSIVLRWTITN